MANTFNNTSELYQVVFSSPEIKTVDDYINWSDSPAFHYAIVNNVTKKNGADDFLAVKGPDGMTNRERIEANFFTPADKKTAGKAASILVLKTGTVLYIPVEKVNRIGLLTEGVQVVSNSTQAFMAKALKNLLSDPLYQSIEKPIKGKLQKGSWKKLFPDISVWIWCRALSNPDKVDDELKGQIFNITPFVEDISTTVSKTGGNFQIKLPPLTCELVNNVWTVKKSTLLAFKSQNSQKKDYFAKDFINQYLSDSTGSLEQMRRNDFLFHSIISNNDLIFIRFETLLSEANERALETDQDFIISNSYLPNCNFDMIGLVDIDGVTMQASSNDVSVRVTGRDLSKLFIDDGTYFYPFEFSQGKLNFAGGSTTKNALMQRVFSDNALTSLGLYINQSIEHVMKFVIQQLSTIKVVPDDLFFYYPNRNTRFDPDSESQQQIKNLDLQNEQYKQQAREAIAQTRTKNGIKESTDASENKKIDQVLSMMFDFRNTIIKQKKTTTTGWSAFIYVNERGIPENVVANHYPVYFKDQLYKSTVYVADNISTAVMQSIQTSKSRSNFTHQQKYQQQLAPGIWQIIFLVLDSSIVNRRMVDSSMSSANGSLINFFQKVCQEPFVEFFMDTYGSNFYLMARKPPFDAIGMRSYVSGQLITELGPIGSNESVDLGDNPPVLIDINDSDVISESLDYDTEVYSWYHFTPQASFMGDDSSYSLTYIPAVFFPEYADIWGSKPMQLVNNYTPFQPLDKKDKHAINLTLQQSFEDLKYMIESTMYLPFTRRGSITISGDRRIKRGMFIRYRPTGEVFYVDTVMQKYSISDNNIDRTTVLQVSRGMVERYIYPQTVEGYNKPISYFNIINTELNFQPKVTKTKSETNQNQVIDINPKSVLSNFKVNKDVFNFFLKRLQLGNKSLFYTQSSTVTVTENSQTLNSRDIVNKNKGIN